MTINWNNEVSGSYEKRQLKSSRQLMQFKNDLAVKLLKRSSITLIFVFIKKFFKSVLNNLIFFGNHCVVSFKWLQLVADIVSPDLDRCLQCRSFRMVRLILDAN